jgi:hypothetical protein
MKPTVVVHIDRDGSENYLACGDVRLLVIDERTPHDRVYEMSSRITQEQLDAIIGGSPVGSCADERHAAIAARINADIDGVSHLKVVK